MAAPSAGRRSALLGLGGALLGAAAPLVEATRIARDVFVLPGVHEDASADNLNAIANVGFAKVLQHVQDEGTLLVLAGVGWRPGVVGHARLPEALAQRREGYLRMLEREMGEAAAAGSDALPPTRLVEDRLDLDLGGGRVLSVTAHGPAHTDADLSLFDPATGTLWLSDLLFVERIPSMDGSLSGWLRELARLAERRIDDHLLFVRVLVERVGQLPRLEDGAEALALVAVGD